MPTFERILVPIDFSEPSERALSAAIELARTFGARLALLHVWSIPNA
ncbi:universal stress protein, partial [Escherichia coli]|nr:universal stress protein [Escherichia coli]